MTAAASCPVTFAVVRNMSGIVSTPRRIPRPSIGKPMLAKTGAMATIEPPGIPGMLKLVTTPVATTVANCCGPMVMPYSRAMNTAPVVTFLVVCAGPLLQLWLGSAYAARSTTAFEVLAVGVLINGLAHLPYAYLLGSGRPDLPAKFHLIELPFYGVIGWLLIRQFGITGAALAWTIRVTLDAALLVAAVWRVSGVSPSRLLGERGGRAVAAVAGLGGAGALTYVLGSQPEVRYALVFASLAAFGVGVWRFVLDDVERNGLLAVLQ